MKHLEIFGFPGSTYVRTARMVCEEKHVDYQLQPLEFGEKSHHALHPFLRMPIARLGKTVLYETLAITTYIDEVFDGSRLTPDHALGRAQMLQWISTCNDYLYSDLVEALLMSTAPSSDSLAAGRRDLEVVDKQLRCTPFLLGNEIYLCDLFLAPIIAFVESSSSKQPLFQGLKGLMTWRDHLWSRESFLATKP